MIYFLYIYTCWIDITGVWNSVTLQGIAETESPQVDAVEAVGLQNFWRQQQSCEGAEPGRVWLVSREAQTSHPARMKRTFGTAWVVCLDRHRRLHIFLILQCSRIADTSHHNWLKSHSSYSGAAWFSFGHQKSNLWCRRSLEEDEGADVAVCRNKILIKTWDVFYSDSFETTGR